MPAKAVSRFNPWHVVFVLDDSGSMKGQRARSLGAAMKDMIAEMRMRSGGTKEYFRISIIRFGTDATILAEAENECVIDPNQVFSLAGTSGGTLVAKALDKASEILLRHPGKSTDFEPFVFFFSDGRPGDKSKALEAGRRVQELKLPSGEVHLITIGVGEANDDFMEELSMRHGEPMYRRLHSPQDIEDFFPVIGTIPILQEDGEATPAVRLARGIVNNPVITI